ncbi:MAG: hypothetical protein IT350_09915 [Deltaproteobacteria bacterium]|nr:hypothetical protein [Deltaproteobacteria bacterium]
MTYSHRISIDHLWGLTAGLLLGAGAAGHALRLVTLAGTPLGARHAVAGFAILLYTLAGVLALLRRREGLWIAILGPVGGVTAVTLAPNAHIDLFQIVLAIPQMAALALSVWLLRARRFG